MPIYGYHCRSCSHEFEVMQRMSALPLTTCEKCGGALRKLLYPVGVQFKGSGFYTTDYRNGGGDGSKAPSKGAESSSDSSASGGKSGSESSGSSGSESSGSSGSESSGSSGSGSSGSSGSSDSASKKPESTAAKE